MEGQAGGRSTPLNQPHSSSSVPVADLDIRSNAEPVVKRKKVIQMNDKQCLNHSMTSEGAMPLTNPKPQGLSKSRNWDANRGLYPRQKNSRNHWSPKKGSNARPGHPALLGSPMKQGKIDSYFPTSPKKTPNRNLPSNRDYAQTNPNHACPQSFGNKQNESSAGTSSWKSPGKCTHATLTLPASGNHKACPPGISLPKSYGSMGKASANTSSSPIQYTTSTPVTNVGNCSTFPASTSSKIGHSSVKSLFQAKGTSRHSTNIVKAFEEDDFITAEMFDNAVGSIEQDQSSQGLMSSVKTEANYPETADFEKALDEEDLLTTEEFDDILQSSQSPVKFGPLKSSPRKTTFGLLGEEDQSFSDDVEDDVDHFNRLPDELLENIFGQLPILDMCLTASSVCKRWNSIISSERFTPWKKRYHQMKKIQNSGYIQQIEILISNGRGISSTACLMQLIEYMKNLRVSDKSAVDYLKDHPRYNEAVLVMKGRTPNIFENQVPHPWCTVATIVILSQSAQEVLRILDCLLLRKEPVSRMDVSECLYCLASALFLFQKRFKINRGLHYRVFHALHILECDGAGNDEEMTNTARRSNRGQQSLFRYGQRQGMSLTPEQLRIINHNLLPTDTIKINAFAGTGKTTTLIKFAQLRPHLSFLYIAFNKTVQQQAAEKFPKNVECRTLHSLAYRAVGFKYKGKMGTMLKPYFITTLLPKVDKKGVKIHHMTLAKYVCTTINHFLASDDAFITTAHAPTMDTTHVPRRALDHSTKMVIANAAERVFQSLCDVNNKDAKITHDVYMKLYELQHPTLEGYDCLLIDEAQDLTLAQQSILLKQRCAKILVGDPHQQIYSFRGATNAMARVQATRMYHLTQSFRFGPEIAYVASCLLEVLKHETKSTIIGTGPKGQVDGGCVGQLATICRSNATLFTEAVKLVDNNENVKIQFSGGIEGYGFDKILDLYYLSLPPEQRGNYTMKDKFISRFKTFEAIKAYANTVDDMELQSRIKLVMQYHSRIPSLVQKIKQAAVKMNGAYLLTTAHKAKGLEFDTVKLTDDFLNDPYEQIPVGTQSLEDEKNILYVAVTRAKKSLQLNSSLKDYLSKVQEKFEYPVLATKVKGESGPPKCQECGTVQNDEQPLLLLERKQIKLTHSIRPMTIDGGFVCPKCVEAPGFEELYGKPPPTEEELLAMERAEIAQQHAVGLFILFNP
nr:F-box DNA helicase 1-like [Lytechinus pictus]